MWRKSITRIKRIELYNILDNSNILKYYKTEWETDYIIDNTLVNGLISLDYIQHIQLLRDNNDLWYDTKLYDTAISILKQYNSKYDYFSTILDQDIKNQSILEYLKSNEIYEFNMFSYF